MRWSMVRMRLRGGCSAEGDGAHWVLPRKRQAYPEGGNNAALKCKKCDEQ